MREKRPLIFGNWKMNVTLAEAVEFTKSLRNSVQNFHQVDFGICPSFVFLKDICAILKDSGIFIAAQNIHSAKNGAFTGEVSALMVKEVGCTHVLLGHSERRHIFGEGDSFINSKVKIALSTGLKPVLCVGEKLEERDGGKTNEVVERQIKEGLKDIAREQANELVIAYEPVWAIGTGETATPEQANEVHSFIRGILDDDYNDIAHQIPIQYGGSVKPENAKELISQPEIDGLLVGGASIKLESFLKIIEEGSH